MWGHYLLTLYRSLTRHRLYAALNVLGLAVGIAVFLVLLLDVRFETSFDRWLPQADNTYRLDETLSFPGLAPRPSAKTTSVIAPILKADYPQIVAYTRLYWNDEPVTVGQTSDREDVRYVDADFFKVLGLPLARGDQRSALSAPDNVVITEMIARKYFGTTDVVGRTLLLTEGGVSVPAHEVAPTSVRVSAVLRDLPRNTHLKLGVLKLITPAVEKRFPPFTDWHSQSGSTYLRFRNHADAQAVQAELGNFLERRAKGSDETKLGDHPTSRLALRLTPLPAIHFETAITSTDFQPNVDGRVVASLAVVGALTLGIAILNYINLATARSALRAKEVAVRKVLGATRAVLIVQFMADSVSMAFLSMLVGLAVTELLLPLVNAGGSDLKLTYWGADSILPILLPVTLLVGLAAGSYPALMLSNFQPARVLAAARMPGGGKLDGRIRNGLVIFQFVAAIALTICTLVLSAQAKYIQTADRGFERSHLILVESLDTPALISRQPVILDELRRIPGVLAITTSSQEPAAKVSNNVEVGMPGRVGAKPSLAFEMVSSGYFTTYGASILAGRAFDRAHKLDDSTAALHSDVADTVGFNVMLNAAAVKSLGFASPTKALGRTLMLATNPMNVIGVVRDVRFLSPHAPVQPQLYVYRDQSIYGAIGAVRFNGDTQAMMAELAAAWRKVAPGEPFVATTAEIRLSDYYLPDQQRARLFTMGAALAVLIGCIGLYGLASFNTARRTKEIGIRKTLGASSGDILKLLTGQFLRPVLIANLIAWPVAYLAMRSWLSGFDQRIALGPLYFVVATLLALVIAGATVAGQAWRVARSEPAKALRHE
ncbi:MAG: ABC transporter permease [Caulobacteraceae bacterium]